jgi:hypothetical protein
MRSARAAMSSARVALGSGAPRSLVIGSQLSGGDYTLG